VKISQMVQTLKGGPAPNIQKQYRHDRKKKFYTYLILRDDSQLEQKLIRKWVPVGDEDCLKTPLTNWSQQQQQKYAKCFKAEINWRLISSRIEPKELFDLSKPSGFFTYHQV